MVRWPFRRRVLRVAIVERGKPVQRMTIDARGARTRLRAGGATVIVREGRAVPPLERAWMRRARPVSVRTIDKAFALSLGLTIAIVATGGVTVAAHYDLGLPAYHSYSPPPLTPAEICMMRMSTRAVPSLADIALAALHRDIARCMPAAGVRGNGYMADMTLHLFLPRPGEAYVHTSSTITGAEADTGTGVDEHRLWSCVVGAVKRFAGILPFAKPQYADLDVLFQPAAGKSDFDALQVTWHPGPEAHLPRVRFAPPITRTPSRLARARRGIRDCFPGAAVAPWSDLIAVVFHVFRPEPDRVYLHTTRHFAHGGAGGVDPEDHRVLRCVRTAVKRYVAALPFAGEHHGDLRLVFAPPFPPGERLRVSWQPSTGHPRPPDPRPAPPQIDL